MLHHALPLGQIFSAVVRIPYLVAFTVRKLALDHVRSETGFVEGGGGHRAETVSGHLAFEAQAVQRKQEGVVADRFITVPAGENVSAPA